MSAGFICSQYECEKRPYCNLTECIKKKEQGLTSTIPEIIIFTKDTTNNLNVDSLGRCVVGEWRSPKYPPENDNIVLVSIRDDSCDNVCYYTRTGFYIKKLGTWIIDDSDCYSYMVNGWTEFPAPYKEK